MYSPERKFHLYLERRYKQVKQLSKVGSLPMLPSRPVQKQQMGVDLFKDSADFLTRINVFAEAPQPKSMHKSEPISMHCENALVDFASYRKDLMDRLNRRTRCQFKFSFEQPKQPVAAPRIPKPTAKSFTEPTVPPFLTTLLKSTFHCARQKNSRKRLHKKPLLHVQQIVSRRKEQGQAC